MSEKAGKGNIDGRSRCRAEEGSALMSKIATREPQRSAQLPRHCLFKVRDGAVSSPSRATELHTYIHATPVRVVHIGAHILSQAPPELKRLRTRVLATRHISCILVPPILRLRSAIQPRRFNGYNHTFGQLRSLSC
ncbi:hypothetical protein K466DRAFT_20763 [Polyporus arcularius HHB13444]|uniref:Uncharacterized protein n=1 Tax=Polyporus arcularius HHB13444 TaxID=1314778 RepID=A0A5C3P0U1_9APHY|nr:hypothetical protein K466DRAFT_20763 [Polyporus arcularius HHB13444]